MNKPIKGWVKASEDNLPKVGNKNIIVRFLGNVYYGKFVNTNGDIELRIPGLKGMYPKDAWKESEYLDETPIQSGEERLLAEIAELKAWKESMISVTPDMQEIGKALGVRLGESIHDKILPGIERLRALIDQHYIDSFFKQSTTKPLK